MREPRAVRGRVKTAQARVRLAAVGRPEAEFDRVLAEQQVGQRFEVHAQLVHDGVDIGVGVDQRQGHRVEFGNDRQHAEDGADQLLEGRGADDLEVERLVPAHDVVVALGLVDQVSHVRAQAFVFGNQVARRRVRLVHDIPFSNTRYLTRYGPAWERKQGFPGREAPLTLP